MSHHLDPRMPSADQCVLRNLLERRAAEMPDTTFAIFPDGSSWTYREARDAARTTANALRALGVGQGDRVISWQPNSADGLRTWFGLNYLGAVYVPINLAYRGKLLEHVVRLAEAKLIVAHRDLAPRLADVDRSRLEAAVLLGGPPSRIEGLAAHAADALASTDTSLPPLERELAPWDTESIIFTSGTTGPSKGVLSSYCHLFWMSTSPPYLGPSDRFMLNLPLFHVGGTLPVTVMLAHGGSISMVDAFNTEAFWSTVRSTGITTTILLGVMAGFLLKQPERSDDKDHPLKTVTMVPLNEAGPAFKKRFGSDVYTHFNMTEISMPIYSEANPTALGSAGRPRPGVSVRIVDENDCEAPVGAVGELVVRTDCPWAMNHGYARNPEATARAWRNGWFHTGDAFRKDAEGVYFFVDRMKDAIRRRGENISSFEVESEILMHPSVREAAAIGVPNEIAEDEVMAVVALVEGAQLDHVEFISFLAPRMPHFMVPRYVRVVEGLPRTPTQKVEKHVLRAEGVTADTWDREKAGILIKREKIGQVA